MVQTTCSRENVKTETLFIHNDASFIHKWICKSLKEKSGLMLVENPIKLCHSLKLAKKVQSF